MTAEFALIASRFVHYLSLSVLFGAALFPFYAFPTTASAPRLPGLRAILIASAALTLLSGLCWFSFGLADQRMSASDIAHVSARDPVWIFRLLLSAGLVLLLLIKRTPHRPLAVILGSLALLASIAWTGRLESENPGTDMIYRIVDASHLLAAGVWLGALAMFLAMALRPLGAMRDGDLTMLHHALERFSGVGTIVVVTLIWSGIIHPGFTSLSSTVYSRLLLAKLALFGAMLCLAAANRFWLTPKLSRALEAERGPKAAIRALQVSLVVETVLGVLIMLLVGWLGTLPLEPASALNPLFGKD